MIGGIYENPPSLVDWSRTFRAGLRRLIHDLLTGRAKAASKALDTSVRKLSCILCLCEDVRMTSTGNDNRLDAQDPTRRRLLPLWPDLVVSRSRNVHVVDLRQRSEEHTSELQSLRHLVCRLLLEKKNSLKSP